MGAKADGRLLDVGCGDGTFLMAAQQKGWTVVGTEMNPHVARSNGLDVRDTIEDVSDRAPFDCITLWHSLEHMRDPRSMLSGLLRLLKSNGRLIIAVPDAGGLQAKMFGRKWFHLDVPRHLYHFDADSLTHLLQSSGYSVRRQWHQELEYDLLGWSQSTLNLLFALPNVFFYCLTGKLGQACRRVGSGLQTMSLSLGTMLSGLLIPAVGIGTLLRHGGTLVVAAGLSEADSL
jgi:SAM-dependent methyltransferase